MFLGSFKAGHSSLSHTKGGGGGGGGAKVLSYIKRMGGGGHNKFKADDFYYFVALPFPVTNDRSLTGDVRPMVQLFVAFEKKTGSFWWHYKTT